MLWISILGIGFGLISIIFILFEIDRSLDACSKLTWLQLINPVNFINAWSPVLGDVVITLSLITLFGMSGMVGMLVSMAGSALISGFLYFRRGKHQVER